MRTAFWFWLLMAIWFIWGLVVGYRGRPSAPPYGPFYWGLGWTLLLFLLFVFIGWKVFPDPLGTLITD